ncbi:MAG: CoA transferase [Pseudomonadales bacterium]|jgi:crotonobetainyl-CoA:carnitine CoA-transferase CaiB-like acyl-CoA transferase
MVAPLEGVRVLEVASWLAAPSCAALMADMGADVIKVEPPIGDTYRRLFTSLLGEDFVHPSYQFDNRGKRGICVNLEDPQGVALVHELAAGSDVFLTNLVPERLARYHLTDKEVHAVAPRVVYAVLAGYGVTGPDSHRAAFDQTAFWARSGAMSVFGDRDDGPLISRGGYGDRTTALNLLSAILAALRVQERTGEGQYVEVTLQRTGVWALASDVCTALFDRQQPEKTSRRLPPNPIWNTYQTRDGRWLVMVMPMAMPYWPKFCTAIGREEWISDPRFETLLDLATNGSQIVPEIEAMFLSEDLAHWREKLDAAGVIWEPVAELPEVVDDPVLREAEAFSMIVHERGGAMEILSAPFHIRDADVTVRGPAPDPGEHTREVFEQAGLDAGRIDALIEKGVIR